MSKPLDERAALYREIRAHLESEREAGSVGVPVVAAPALARREPVLQSSEQGGTSQAAEKAVAQSVGAAQGPSQGSGSVDQRFGEEGRGLAAASPVERHLRLAQLEEEVRGCMRCELATGRSKTVFARGNPDSPLVFVGEGPGQEEDQQGLPFVGAAGQLLDKMVSAMGFGRDDVYICNVVKCRPPGNRTPLPGEAQACSSYLHGQLEAVRPRVMVALGRCAAENMGLVPGGGGWRGQWGTFRGVDVMPTYHPAFLLRSPEFKRPVWEDLQKVMARLRGSS